MYRVAMAFWINIYGCQPYHRLGPLSVNQLKNDSYCKPGLYCLQLGSCKDEDIAARVLTRVIGHFPGARNQIIIDGGWLALSEQGFEELGGTFAVIKVSILFTIYQKLTIGHHCIFYLFIHFLFFFKFFFSLLQF